MLYLWGVCNVHEIAFFHPRVWRGDTIALADMMFLLGTTFWPESITELRPEFPQKSPGWLKRLYIGIKDVI